MAKPEDSEMNALESFFGESLKLHQLISWCVLEEYAHNPFKGWLDDLSVALSVKTDEKSSEKKTNISQRLHELVEGVSD